MITEPRHGKTRGSFPIILMLVKRVACRKVRLRRKKSDTQPKKGTVDEGISDILAFSAKKSIGLYRDNLQCAVRLTSTTGYPSLEESIEGTEHIPYFGHARSIDQ